MKKKWIPEPDEFFIGYLPEAPEKTSSFLRQVLVGVSVVIVIISAVLVISQRDFSSAVFDYGTYTTMEGYILNHPVPHLKVNTGLDSAGRRTYRTVLLVGFGKAGADRTLKQFESQLGALEGKIIRISGERIHGYGKSLLQIAAERVPQVLSQGDGYENPNQLKEVAATSPIRGEIIDPKCFFGVMKPGEGKPHRSCAIRCIAGGIPPVFHSTGDDGYYLLLDENFQPVNQRILDFVGDNIELTGTVVQWDDWKILLIKNEELNAQSITSKLTRNLAMMNEGMTQCATN
jgi:hypothetical protein